MPTKIVHLCLSVRGAIRNYRDWIGAMTNSETGEALTASEIQDALMDELTKGHEVIPFGEPCEGFDYAGGGCPGHPVEGATE